MIINRYRASSLNVAITKANAEMGPEAKILHVKQLDGNDKNSTAERIEIIAVVDEEENNNQENLGKRGNIKSRSIDMLVDDDFNLKASAENKQSKEYKTDDQKKSLGAIKIYNSHINHGDRNPNGKNIWYKKLETNNFTKKEKVVLGIENNEISESKELHDDNNLEESKMLSTHWQRLLCDDDDYIEDNKDVKSYDSSRETDSNNMGVIIRKSSSNGTNMEYSTRRQNMKGSKSRIYQMLYECLMKNHVDNEIAYELLTLLNGDITISENKEPGIKDYLSVFMESQIGISEGLDLSKNATILIGPTGVGKTTTLAKLAAQYHFRYEKSVGLITTDAYRIAAVEQLKTYAQIMSIPLKVALTPEQLEKCLEDYRDMDIVLIDTPGRSQLNKSEIRIIEEFLEAAQPADTHLLISASSKETDAYIVAESFAPDYVQSLIFTKLDETSSFGSILNVCAKAKKPISYLTNGQNVPDDIKLAEIQYLVDLFITRNRIN